MRRGPRLFFSFRSPFSRFLVERLVRAVPDAHERIEFVPYWEPDPGTERALAELGAAFHYTQMSKAKHLYILQDTRRIAERLGLPLAWPVDVNPWWEVAHLGWLQARRLGRAADFYAAVVQARWERGENISDPAVMHAVSAAIGLDGDAIVAATHDPDIRAEGVACLVEAYEDDIFGVPYLRLGWRRFWGYDRLDEFLRWYLPAVDGGGAASGPPAEIPAAVRSGPGYDSDTAGGCG